MDSDATCKIDLLCILINSQLKLRDQAVQWRFILPGGFDFETRPVEFRPTDRLLGLNRNGALQGHRGHKATRQIGFEGFAIDLVF